jgi:hypothetical protein
MRPDSLLEACPRIAKKLLSYSEMGDRDATERFGWGRPQPYLRMAVKDIAHVETVVDQYFPDTVLPAATIAVIEKLLTNSKGK